MPHIHGASVIDIIGRPVQGTRHEVLLGRERASGAPVVVKVELVEGALATERQALEWISGHGAGWAAPSRGLTSCPGMEPASSSTTPTRSAPPTLGGSVISPIRDTRR